WLGRWTGSGTPPQPRGTADSRAARSADGVPAGPRARRSGCRCSGCRTSTPSSRALGAQCAPCSCPVPGTRRSTWSPWTTAPRCGSSCSGSVGLPTRSEVREVSPGRRAAPWNNRAMPVDLTYDDPASDVLLDPATGVRRSILPGGVRLLTQRDRSVRSATIGLWLPVGSRDESPAHAGSTHVLEHLLFKGTRRRSAMDIAPALVEVGGASNALTAKEHTLYYGRVRSADIPMAVDVLTDMITASLLEQDALATEREVILEELAMAEDDPTDVGYETFL